MHFRDDFKSIATTVIQILLFTHEGSMTVAEIQRAHRAWLGTRPESGISKYIGTIITFG